LLTTFHSEIFVRVFPNSSIIWFGIEVTRCDSNSHQYNSFSVLYAFNAPCFYSYCSLFRLMYNKPTSGW